MQKLVSKNECIAPKSKKPMVGFASTKSVPDTTSLFYAPNTAPINAKTLVGTVLLNFDGQSFIIYLGLPHL